VFIFMYYKIYHHEDGSQVVKNLSYGCGDEGSSLILDILQLWLKLAMLMWQEKIKTMYTHGANDVSLVQQNYQ
jgi:hypothetical protein